jgi:hypothetical protein
VSFTNTGGILSNFSVRIKSSDLINSVYGAMVQGDLLKLRYCMPTLLQGVSPLPMEWLMLQAAHVLLLMNVNCNKLL